MKALTILFACFIIFACNKQQKDFSQIKKGMNKNEVLALAGEPTKKNNLGVAEFWTYDAANRTVVFRKDTVYNIMTSSEARIDSLKMSTEETGEKIKQGAKETGQGLKEKTKKLENKIDSANNK
jgi:hypothetical protein